MKQPPSLTYGDDAPYPEPVFSGALLFWLPAILSLCAIATEGVHFGFYANSDRLTLPLLHFLERGSPKGDALSLILPHWVSPFWQLVAVFDSGNASPVFGFTLLAIACRLLSVAAVFRLAERLFRHPLGAALAAILWVLDPALGGIALHHTHLQRGRCCLRVDALGAGFVAGRSGAVGFAVWPGDLLRRAGGLARFLPWPG